MIVPRQGARIWRRLQQGIIPFAWGMIDWFVRVTRGRPIRRFTDITPNLKLGGQPGQDAWVNLFTNGVTAIVNMRDEYDYKELVELGTVKYLHIPVVDNTAPTLEQLKLGAEFMRNIIENDGVVYVHCKEGWGRGPTMAAAYFVSVGYTPHEAMAKIREARPFISPNALQMARLNGFAENYSPSSSSSA